MNKELQEAAERPPYFELVDKKAESNNTIDLDAYAKGVEDGVIWQTKRMFSEEDMRKMYDISCGIISLNYVDDQTENNKRFNYFLNEIKK
jgi:hypothetical protein